MYIQSEQSDLEKRGGSYRWAIVLAFSRLWREKESEEEKEREPVL
jgi:hypothetical protein